MVKKIFIISALLCSFQALSQDSKLELNPCPRMSKDPKCWKPLYSRTNASYRRATGLVCSSYGKVAYLTYHGEGGGCGESGKVIITKQTRDWSTKTVYVETKWMPPTSQTPGRCHYWGPITGGGAIDTFIGTWKVVLNNKLLGSYTFKVETEQENHYESKYTESCIVHLK